MAWRRGEASGAAAVPPSTCGCSTCTDRPAGIPSLIGRVEGSCLPRGWGGAGVFATVYSGQDYYNLGFAETITRLQFGVTLQRDQLLSFRIASR